MENKRKYDDMCIYRVSISNEAVVVPRSPSFRVFVYALGVVITGAVAWSRPFEIHLAASNRKANRVSSETRTLSRGDWLAGCEVWIAVSHPVP